jgi:serine/threonine-protein kinase
MSSENLIGKQFGSYELREILGRGGMAAVFRGYQAAIDRSVAVKVLPAELLHDPNFGVRFFNEARTLAKMTHPSILPLYDFGEANGMPYIVMPLMSKGTLADRLKSGPLPLSEVLRIITPVAQALDYANKQGVLHRDVKPNNILFDQHDNPYLADFGIAKVLESNTNLTGTGIIGTPDYMSPEQARGETLDHRSDLYALGVVTYQCLTGQALFRATTPMGIIFKHVSEAPQPLRAFRADLPAEVEKVVLRALAKDPNARYATTTEFARALTTAVNGGAQPEMGTVVNVAAPTTGANAPSTQAPAGPTPTGPTPASQPFSLPPAVNTLENTPAITATPPARKRGLPMWAWVGGGLGVLLVCGLCAAVVFGASLLGNGGMPTPSATILYSDDFSSSGEWGTDSSDISDKLVEDGQFLIRVKQSGYLSWSVPGQSLEAVRVEATIRSDGLPEAAFGVICNFQDNDNFYLGGVTGDGYYAVIRKVDGEYTVLNDATNNQWQPSDLVPLEAESYQIALECYDGLLRLYANGALIDEVQDYNLSSGDIGLFAQTFDNAPAEVRFDNLRVTKVE